MNRWVLLMLPLLVIGPACADWGTGCQPKPLERELGEENIGLRAIEFFVPGYRLVELGDVWLESLLEEERAVQWLELPAMRGDLGEQLRFEIAASDLEIDLSAIRTETDAEGLAVHVHTSDQDLLLALDVLSDDEPLRTCALQVSLAPVKTSWKVAVWTDEDGISRLEVVGEPMLSGGHVETALEDGCPEQPSSQVHPIVVAALEEALYEGTAGLVEEVGQLAAASLGLTCGDSGELAGWMFDVSPSDGQLGMGSEAFLLELSGGFEAIPAECVPADLLASEPCASPGAEFEAYLPEDGGEYGLAVSISRAFLQQALSSAHRAGLLCRYPAENALAHIQPATDLPSLATLPSAGPTRAAVWPAGDIQLQFANTGTDVEEKLPRLTVIMTDVHLDLYQEMDGADLRVLGAAADLKIDLIPRIEAGLLYLQAGEAHASDLQIEFSELAREAAGELRTGATALFESTSQAVVDSIPPIPLALPACASTDVLEFQVQADRVVLYFEKRSPDDYPRP